MNEIFKEYGTVNGDTLTLTTGTLYNDFRNALNNTSITKIAFDEDITSVPTGAFQGCTNLTSVDLGKVTEIGQSAFYGCTGLTSVDLTNATQIDLGAFSACTSLTHIRLGADMYALSSNPSTGVHPNAFNNIASEVHVYYSDNANAAQQKWEELKLTMTSGTQVKYHPDSEWENREKNDNAAEALPDAMKGLLALAERLG